MDKIIVIAVLLAAIFAPWIVAIIGYNQRKKPAQTMFGNTIQEAKYEFRGEYMEVELAAPLMIIFLLIIDICMQNILLSEIIAFILASLVVFWVKKKMYTPPINEEYEKYYGKIVDWKYQMLNAEHAKHYFPILEFKYKDGNTYYVKGIGRNGKFPSTSSGKEPIFIGKTSGLLFFSEYNHKKKKSIIRM